jgi:hypothetical protein
MTGRDAPITVAIGPRATPAKGAIPDHVRRNRAAHDIHLTGDDPTELGRELPPPRRKIPLEVL